MNIRIQLPQPHPGQQKVLDSRARFKVLQCGRRWGKSLACMVIAITRMLKAESVSYVCPEFGLAKDFFRDILRYLPEALIRIDNKSELYIELVTGGSLRFFSGQALDSFRGRKFHMLIVDEAAFIPDLEHAWYSAMRPTLSDYQGEAIFISTPRGKNFFHSLFIKGKNGEDGYESFHYPTNTNPYFPAEEFESARKSIPTARFNEEYLAIAGENSANPFNTDNIKRGTIQELSTEPTVVLGIDLAKYNDYTVICGLDAAGRMSYFDRFQLPWQLTQDRIAALPSNILKVVDSTGVGDVVFEALQLRCQNIQGFKFTSESKPKIIYELIKDVEQGNVQFNETTADEMMVYEYKYTASGHITFNAMSGYHDDTVCALAIANRYKNQAVADAEWFIDFGD